MNQYGAAKATNTDDIAFNALLVQDMKLLSGSDVTVFDSAAVVKQMDTPGNQWGFTEGLGSPCYAGGSLAGAVGNGATLCSIPSQYVQWDSNGHLTASAYQVAGDAMYSTLPVPEPTSLCSLIFGVLTMCSRRQLRSAVNSSLLEARQQLSDQKCPSASVLACSGGR